MGRESGAARLAALAICEAILLSLTGKRVIDAAEAGAILADAAAAHRGATPSTAAHGEAAAIIEAMLAGGASVRRARLGAAAS